MGDDWWDEPLCKECDSVLAYCKGVHPMGTIIRYLDGSIRKVN